MSTAHVSIARRWCQQAEASRELRKTLAVQSCSRARGRGGGGEGVVLVSSAEHSSRFRLIDPVCNFTYRVHGCHRSGNGERHRVCGSTVHDLLGLCVFESMPRCVEELLGGSDWRDNCDEVRCHLLVPVRWKGEGGGRGGERVGVRAREQAARGDRRRDYARKRTLHGVELQIQPRARSRPKQVASLYFLALLNQRTITCCAREKLTQFCSR